MSNAPNTWWRWWPLGLIIVVVVAIVVALLSKSPKGHPPESRGDREIVLPMPRRESDVSVEEALQQRRSIRDYAEAPLTIVEVGQLLWAAQGITDERGYHTAPSAGALYPLELYVVVGKVETLAPGVYHYDSHNHALERVADGDRRQALAREALEQDCVRQGAIDIVFTAVYERTTAKYGQRGRQYVHMEAGHAAQNVYLQCVPLKLGAVVVGAFQDKGVQDVLELPEERIPLYIMPVGKLP
ncbi:MAG: SagB/ThcOx family dehydrogenase [Chloroflexota bacterium]|nr:SagB/ThcOx family dehydrogenase [Chloroflexota bacterium]